VCYNYQHDKKQVRNGQWRGPEYSRGADNGVVRKSQILYNKNMKKMVKKLDIQFDILREGKVYIAYSPALDLATHAKTLTKVKERFVEATDLFLESIVENGKLEETLTNLGWVIRGDSYVPPTIISREVSPFSIPVVAYGWQCPNPHY